ncbi:MAG TPA: LamG-like jellyroll fold domain-containing protein [Verrucomicrobiales bacterium]|jgi:hypothetical protein|nr:LamG-like jellyroll fold domain-containing protein [Verrucomicrobiales bacterium]
MTTQSFFVSRLGLCRRNTNLKYPTRLIVCFVLLGFAGRGRGAADNDFDGIPSTWESTYSGSPAYMSDSDPFDASEDPDGDFLTNLEEYIAGTNPTDADSDDDGLSDRFSKGLQCYWRFSETAGAPASTANSVSGGPSLTLNGASLVTGGLFGNALSPTSYTQKVTTSAAVLSNATDWSFSGWFKLDSTNANHIIFSSRADANSANKIGVSLSGGSWGSMTLYVALNGSEYPVTVNIAQSSGYHHLVVSRDLRTNRANVYLDGELAGSVTPSSSPEPLSFASTQFKVSTREVTGYGGSYNNYIYGSLDDVRIYNRRLEAAEVDVLYEHGSSSANASKYWTLSYLLNNPQGQEDADSDGFTNLAEVVAGTDPQSSGSKPAPASSGYQLHTKLG